MQTAGLTTLDIIGKQCVVPMVLKYQHMSLTSSLTSSSATLLTSSLTSSSAILQPHLRTNAGTLRTGASVPTSYLIFSVTLTPC